MCSRQVCVIAGASSEWLEIKKGTGPSSFMSCVSNSRLEVVANTRLSFNICNCQCLREENWRIRSKSPRRIAVSCFLSRQKLTVDFLPPPLCHRYNGSLPNGDRGRRKSRFALYKRTKANGVKPSTVHIINTPQASKVLKRSTIDVNLNEYTM